MAWMYKEIDGEISPPHYGDCGPMSEAIWPDDWDKCYASEETDINTESNARPRVGVVIRVGSFYARSYTFQDWYQTSQIVEIIEDTLEQVRFKTKSGSVYVWKP